MDLPYIYYVLQLFVNNIAVICIEQLDGAGIINEAGGNSYAFGTYNPASETWNDTMVNGAKVPAARTDDGPGANWGTGQFAGDRMFSELRRPRSATQPATTSAFRTYVCVCACVCVSPLCAAVQSLSSTDRADY